MPLVRCLHFYLGKSPAAKNASPAQNLFLDDDGFLCQRFRRSLLHHSEPQRAFRVGIEIPELPPIAMQWTWIGQTAGVALWIRDEGAWAGSILVNGLERDDEREQVVAAFAVHSITVPSHVWEPIRQEPKPLIATMHPHLASLLDPVIATAAPALANSFFALFGTHGD